MIQKEDIMRKLFDRTFDGLDTVLSERGRNPNQDYYDDKAERDFRDIEKFVEWISYKVFGIPVGCWVMVAGLITLIAGKFQ